jgi:hypothetical protein
MISCAPYQAWPEPFVNRGGLAISLFYQPLVAADRTHDSKPQMRPHHPISARFRALCRDFRYDRERGACGLT